MVPRSLSFNSGPEATSVGKTHMFWKVFFRGALLLTYNLSFRRRRMPTYASCKMGLGGQKSAITASRLLRTVEKPKEKQGFFRFRTFNVFLRSLPRALNHRSRV